MPLPAGAVLLCPIIDLSMRSLSLDTDDPTHRTFIELGRRCIDAYVAGHSTLDPLVSPLFGDLSGLPPLLIQAGGSDLMVGDARALHDRARAHGSRHRRFGRSIPGSTPSDALSPSPEP